MCTSIAFLDNLGFLYHGRTLELSAKMDSFLTYYPTAVQFQKTAPDGSNAQKYTSKYEILGISTEAYNDGDNHNIFQGMNSAGLVFSANMISNGSLNELPPEEYKSSIPITAIGEWALSNFATVTDVTDAINHTHFWCPELSTLDNPQSQLHYAFYDKHGGSIVVEALNGKLHVYNNPTRVMTNGPSFPWHLENLNNYTHLSNLDRSSGRLAGINVIQPDSGIAVSSLPSSDTSVDRFIRAAYYVTFAPIATSPDDAMNILSHTMNNFDRLKNITLDTVSESGATIEQSSEYTLWTSLTDLNQGIMKIRLYEHINYQTVSFADFKLKNTPYFERLK